MSSVCHDIKSKDATLNVNDSFCGSNFHAEILSSGVGSLKFGYSEKTTQIWSIFHLQFVKLKVEDEPIFCGLLRISEL